MAVAVERSKAPSDTRDLNRVLLENNWNVDGKIQHFFTLEKDKVPGQFRFEGCSEK